MISSLDIILTVVAAALPGLVLLYAGFWGFNIRRALAVPTYRRQALGIGLVALSFASLFLGGFVVPGDAGASLFQASLFFSMLMTFYWIDASVLASRRSDPLLRDTFHWSRLRIPLMVTIIFSTVVFYSMVFYTFVVTGIFVNANSADQLLSGVELTAATLALILPIVITSASAIIILPVAALRSKDKTFRRHLIWFGLFVASFPLILVIIGNFYPPWVVAYVVSGYLLYKSAISLTPLKRPSTITYVHDVDQAEPRQVTR